MSRSDGHFVRARTVLRRQGTAGGRKRFDFDSSSSQSAGVGVLYGLLIFHSLPKPARVIKSKDEDKGLPTIRLVGTVKEEMYRSTLS